MTGIITSNKMTKAVVVTVFSTKLHDKYKKRYKSKKKYAAACVDSATFKLGDKVEIVSIRPISKTISFKVVE
jgi:small subunit ribosomal protein S17